jgi:hypothetical protein
MFTQIFQAVENLSNQSHPPSTDEPRGLLSRSNSIDSQLRPSPPLPVSSGQLAESALLTLRKSLASQRPGSPGSLKNSGVRDHRLPKSTLEDRLRAAAFAIGEASNPSSTGASARVSPTPTSQRPLSPCSTPLPESPKTSLEMEAAVPLAPPAASTLTTSAVQLTSSPPRRSLSKEFAAHTSESMHPLPLGEPSATTDLAQDLPESAPVELDIHSSSTDVEGLQERLKEVEQRFTGTRRSPNMNYPNFFFLQMFQLHSRSCRPRKLLLTWLSAS